MAYSLSKLAFFSLMVWTYVKISDSQLPYHQEMISKDFGSNQMKPLQRQYGESKTGSEKKLISTAKTGLRKVNRFGDGTVRSECTYAVHKRSVAFFQSRMHNFAPNFIQFGLAFNESINQTVTDDVFKPKHWFWTYSTPLEKFPYLSWNIDYGVLSFNLLDTKSIEVHYVLLNVQNNPCSAQLGSLQTTQNIVNALTELLNGTKYHGYDLNMFCFLSKDLQMNGTLEYKLALYFGMPVTYIGYRCCNVKYDFINETYVRTCTEKTVEKWSQCLIIPYILGVIFFLYSPIPLFKICAWIAKDEKINNPDYAEIREDSLEEDLGMVENWVYLDGDPPVTIFDILASLSCNVNEKFPLLISRFRRICVLIIGPLIIYIQLYMYSNGMGVGTHKLYVRDLARVGTPMGFLALLADRKDRNVFASLLGGAMCILIMYHLVGFIIIVLPKSLKQIVESGLPRSRLITDGDNLPISPFCFSATDIIRMSMATLPVEKGYKKAATMLKYSIYMLCTYEFWMRLIAIQRQRLKLCHTNNAKTTRCLRIVIFPLILISGFAESVLSVAFFAVPFFNFVIIMVRGFIRELLNVTVPRNCVFHLLFRNPVSTFLGYITVVFCLVIFAYSLCLIFVNSFFFVAQVIAFCFVAVIIYPNVSFGYLFFFVVLVYYLVRLVRNFGDGYLKLLSIAVERSIDIENNVNYVTVFGNRLVVSNVRVQSFKSIMINDCLLSIPQNTIQAIQNNTTKTCRIRKQGNIYGIPKQLFSDLIKEYRPMHIQFVNVILHLALIIILITVILTITSKFVASPSSEISDVMHVIFLVVVGALPRILELALINEGKVVKKEAESRAIEQSILEYWDKQRCAHSQTSSAQ